MSSTLYTFKTLTSDNGTEFASHKKIAEITGAQFFFARPYHSWERGLNEHTNGQIRRFYPKGTDFNQVSDEEIAELEHTHEHHGAKIAWLQIGVGAWMPRRGCIMHNIHSDRCQINAQQTQ